MKKSKVVLIHIEDSDGLYVCAYLPSTVSVVLRRLGGALPLPASTYIPPSRNW